MEKAIDRQRVLLAHLLPSSASASASTGRTQLSASACAAGDSAAYQRSSCFADDIVICLPGADMQGQARKLQGHVPGGPFYSCPKGSGSSRGKGGGGSSSSTGSRSSRSRGSLSMAEEQQREHMSSIPRLINSARCCSSSQNWMLHEMDVLETFCCWVWVMIIV